MPYITAKQNQMFLWRDFYSRSTVWVKKTIYLIFDNNFGKCRPISKFFHYKILEAYVIWPWPRPLDSSLSFQDWRLIYSTGPHTELVDSLQPFRRYYCGRRNWKCVTPWLRPFWGWFVIYMLERNIAYLFTKFDDCRCIHSRDIVPSKFKWFTWPWPCAFLRCFVIHIG